LNDSGVDGPRPCGYQNWIGDVRYASYSRGIAACREPSRRAQKLTLSPCNLCPSQSGKRYCRTEEPWVAGPYLHMNDFSSAFYIALKLIGGLDAELLAIIALSLRVSLIASVIAFAIGAPLGVALAIYRFPARGMLVVVANALLGLPPVVVGLAVYMMLSRSGPLGPLGLLFTPTAMIIAQAALGTPIVVALVHRVAVWLWRAYGDSLLMSGASRLRTIVPLMGMGRDGLLTAFLAAFGRAIAEVGAIIIVGGNIRGYTRTMTTTIALETSRGDLSLALALGIILLCLSMAVSAISLFLVPGLPKNQ
jgi:tungstate transport system permease protein